MADDAPPRHFALEMSIPCPGCRTALPVNGPQRDLFCTDCTRECSISDEIWGHLDRADDTRANREYDTGGLASISGGERMIWRKAAPACPACRAPIPVDTLGVGVDGEHACQGCGAAIRLVAPPAWLTAMAPSLVQLYGAERADEARGGPVEGAAPIVFPCPQCGGALRVTGETSRVMRCTYCGVDAFLPDPLWLRLHPRKQIRPWFLRFEGTSAVDAARAEERATRAREEAERRAARAREEAEERAAAESEARAEARAAAAEAFRVNLAIGGGILVAFVALAVVLILS